MRLGLLGAVRVDVTFFSAPKAPSFGVELELIRLRKACANSCRLSLDLGSRLSGGGVGSWVECGGAGHGLWFDVTTVGVLGSHSFLIEGDSESLEVVQVIRASSDQIALNLELEALIECGRDHFVIVEFCLKDELLESFDISANRSGLLQAGMETIASLLLRVEVSPLVEEIPLE